ERYKNAGLVERARLQLRTDAVAQTFLLPDANRQTRVQESAADHVIAKHQRRVVRIIIAHIQVLARDKKRVSLIRRLERLIHRRNVFEDLRDSSVGLLARPIAE